MSICANAGFLQIFAFCWTVLIPYSVQPQQTAYCRLFYCYVSCRLSASANSRSACSCSCSRCNRCHSCVLSRVAHASWSASDTAWDYVITQTQSATVNKQFCSPDHLMAFNRWPLSRHCKIPWHFPRLFTVLLPMLHYSRQAYTFDCATSNITAKMFKMTL